MNVYYEDGQRLTLDNGNVIGSGGEGTVFRLQDDPASVIKIYESPSKDQAQKLADFLQSGFSLPKTVAAPKRLVYDGRNKVIGFSMPFFYGAKAVRELSSKKYRNALSFGNRDVSEIMADAALTLEKIHAQGLVVGDLNDLNVLFAGKDALYIDVDSWQFDRWPCPVAMENFLDPDLYNHDLSLRPYFSFGNDWYSYAVMLFRSLLLVHPYGGTHLKIRSLTERATRRMMVFDKSVTYPAIAFPPEIISEELGEIFYKYFQQGWRGEFPVSELIKYNSDLVKCGSCHNDFPKNRRLCPVCKEQNKDITSQTLPGSVSVRVLLRTFGNIVFSRIEDSSLILIAEEGGEAVLYVVDLNRVKRTELFPYIPGTRFEASERLVATNEPGSSKVEVYEVFDDLVIKSDDTITDIYKITQNAVFRVSGKYLYRMIGSNLIQTEMRNGHQLNTTLRLIIDGQSWFAISDECKTRMVGFSRVLRQQFYWLYDNGRSVDLSVPQLTLGEALTDQSIKFSSDSIMIVRKTEYRGETFVRFDLFDINGKSLYSGRVTEKNLPTERIHGLAYARGKLIFPTDAGAVRFDPASGSTVSFSATNKVINSSQSIFVYGSGIMLVDSKTVSFLTLN